MQHSVERQITVALENQPGRLAAICGLLAARGINICALSVVDNVVQGVVRIISRDVPGCRAALTAGGFYLVEADVLALDLTDRPGQIARVCGALAAARINVDYAYYTGPGRADSRSQLVCKVSNLPQALEILQALPED